MSGRSFSITACAFAQDVISGVWIVYLRKDLLSMAIDLFDQRVKYVGYRRLIKHGPRQLADHIRVRAARADPDDQQRSRFADHFIMHFNQRHLDRVTC